MRRGAVRPVRSLSWGTTSRFEWLRPTTRPCAGDPIAPACQSPTTGPVPSRCAKAPTAAHSATSYYRLHVRHLSPSLAVLPAGRRGGAYHHRPLPGGRGWTDQHNSNAGPETESRPTRSGCSPERMCCRAPSPNRFRSSRFPTCWSSIRITTSPPRLPPPMTCRGRSTAQHLQGPARPTFFKFRPPRATPGHSRSRARTLRSPARLVLVLFQRQGADITSNDDTAAPTATTSIQRLAHTATTPGHLTTNLKRGGRDFVYRIEVPTVSRP